MHFDIQNCLFIVRSKLFFGAKTKVSLFTILVNRSNICFQKVIDFCSWGQNKHSRKLWTFEKLCDFRLVMFSPLHILDQKIKSSKISIIWLKNDFMSWTHTSFFRSFLPNLEKLIWKLGLEVFFFQIWKKMKKDRKTSKKLLLKKTWKFCIQICKKLKSFLSKFRKKNFQLFCLFSKIKNFKF